MAARKPYPKGKKLPEADDTDYTAELVSAEGSVTMLKDRIAKQCVQQFCKGLKYKEKRMGVWLEIERTYNLEKEKNVQSGHFDYPIPVLSGFIDTLHSKIDDEPALEYEHLTLADKTRAEKVSAAWRFYSNPQHADWASEDRAGKKMAIMTGRAIYITYCESDPEFAHHFDLIDSYDYVAEVMGGGDIRKHKYGFQDNVFRSKWDLKNAPHYDPEQVKKLINACSDKSFEKNSIANRNKINRLVSVGLNPSEYDDYAGDGLYRLSQGFTTYEGETYWVVMDMSTGVWLRCDPISEVFASGRHPFVSWATHYDKFNFWSKCPAEDVLPVSRGMRDLYNEGMYNIKKRNSGSRAYDPDVFEEPELLEYRPDGLVPAVVTPGKSISSGVYEFQTADNTQIIVNMFQFSDNMLGTKTGITPGSQGQSDKDTKVGVYYGDLQQVADRIGLTNKYYVAAWQDAGDLFAWGLWEHFPSELMVRVTGQNDWEELKKEDLDPDFAVTAKSGKAELEANLIKKKQQTESLASIMMDPVYKAYLNPILAVKEKLSAGGWDEDKVRALMDVQTLGDEDSLVKASQAIQDLLLGKKPRVYRKATLAFLKKIKDYLDENEMDMATERAFATYFALMMPIVTANTTRRGMFGAPQMTAPGMVPPNPMQPTPVPVPGTSPGTAAMSQDMSNTMTPSA